MYRSVYLKSDYLQNLLRTLTSIKLSNIEAVIIIQDLSLLAVHKGIRPHFLFVGLRYTWVKCDDWKENKN